MYPQLQELSAPADVDLVGWVVAVGAVHSIEWFGKTTRTLIF